VSGSGYRFIADFSCSENIKPQASIDLITVPNETSLEYQELPDKPSIAIMDFNHLGNHEKSSLLAMGLTTEISSALARFPHLFVIARASASILSKKNLSSIEVGKYLGVRYLVYGELEQVAKRIRVSFSIVDATQNIEVWSDHFDRSLDDFFQIQDDISNAIVTATDSAIERAETERAFLVRTEDLSAWENFHRGLGHANKTKLKDVDISQHYFKKAIELDPRFSRAYAGLSYTHINRALLNHKPITSSNSDMAKGFEYAERSIDICKYESMGYMSLGRAKLFSNHLEQATLIIDQAIYLCPSNEITYVLKAQALSRLCIEHKQISKSLELSKRLNPHCRINNFNVYIARAMAMFNQKNYIEADRLITKSLNFNNSYYLTYAIAAVCKQKIGNTKSAQQCIAQALTLLPGCTIGSCERLFPVVKEPREIFKNTLIDVGMPLAH
jgi:TolB-like protein